MKPLNSKAPRSKWESLSVGKRKKNVLKASIGKESAEIEEKISADETLLGDKDTSTEDIWITREELVTCSLILSKNRNISNSARIPEHLCLIPAKQENTFLIYGKN
ncbi:MAG: uncharacterized protein A8A55_2406 [Amphiamblys sp. WSBS2006]|nr:MAG: uncharacterized protein A8A55_2406 [Amphiamblys sp. WSBS2006]